MAPNAAPGQLDVGGRRLQIRHLDRVVFPRTGTTKGELLDYYIRVSGAMLPHLRDRLLHMHRYPEGVEGPRFWQKACPEHRPDWLPVAPVWSRDKQANIDYCVINELAGLLWAVNLGSIELHTSLHLRDDLHHPPPSRSTSIRARAWACSSAARWRFACARSTRAPARRRS